MSSAPPQSRWLAAVGLSARVAIPLFVARLIVDTANRMMYPFLPQFAAGTGLGVAGFGWMLSARAWAGLTGPIFGLAADRFGRRPVLLVALAAVVVGMLGMIVLHDAALLAPMLVLGAASSAFIPAQQALVSDLAPPERRGRALAAVDMSFSLAGLVMLPLLGLAVEGVGWQAPFVAVAALALAAAAPIALMPAGDGPGRAASSQRAAARLQPTAAVAATVGATTAIFLGYAAFFTTWGVWLNQAFALGAAGAGAMANAVGGAEFAGVVLAGLFIDRIGKKRALVGGLGLTMTLTAAWVAAGADLDAARVALVVLGGAFEFTLVALFPVVADQAPRAAATMFALVSVGASVGMAAGSPLGIAVWDSWRLPGVGAVAACALAVGAVLIGWKSRSHPAEG